jgi:adenylate cyclase
LPRFALSLLGSFQATLDGQPVTAFESAKARALLAYLAVESERPHTREKLAGLLWPDSTESAARGSLSQALTNLRHVLGERDDDPPVLLASRQAIQFNHESDPFVDVLAFTDLTGRRDLTGLEQAVALYRGRFLEGFSLPGSSEFEEWLLLEQEYLHRRAVEVLARLAAAYEERGEIDRALAFAWRQLELDPWRESAHRQAMRLLARSGRRDAALAQYQACCRQLADELAAEPSPETVQVYEQIRDGRLPAPPAPRPEPEEPPLSLPGFVTGRAPPVATRPVFVARDKELARLDALLAAALDGQGQAAFVVGGPGRGKTVLLREFARRALDAHPDLLLAMGTCNAYSGVGDPYLPFRGALAMLTGDAEAPWAAGSLSAAQARRMWDALPDVAPVLARWGSGLVGTLLPGRELLGRARAAAAASAPIEAGWLFPLERVADPRSNAPGGLEQSHLFEQCANVLIELSARHPLLIVLDDLHWADLASISLLFHLGRRIEQGWILIAGAYRPDELAVGRDGERHPLEPVLADLRARFGDAWLDLAAADEAEGRTFVDRFVDSEPNALDEQFRGALFGWTRGHPLFTVELLRAMQQRGNLVRDEAGRWTEGDRLEWGALPARAEAVIAERVDRLPEELRELLVVASVEGEEFTAQAVARVQGMDELQALRLLRGQLATRHRLLREQGELRLGGYASGRSLSRYRFSHFLVQQHLYQGLGNGERRLLHRRVGEALEGLYEGRAEEVAVQLAHHFAGDAERERRYARLAGEQAAAQFANEEAVRYLSRALELTPESERSERCELLLAREKVHDLLGRRDAQRQDLAELEALADGLGSEQQAEVNVCRSLFARRSGDYGAAVAAAQAAMQHAQAAGQADVEAWGRFRWGESLWCRGDVLAARARFEEALALARAGGLHDLEARVLLLLSDCAENLSQEQGYLEQALRIAREAGDRSQECWLLDSLGFFRLQAGDLAGTRIGLERCLRLAREIGERKCEGYVLEHLGQYCEVVGDYGRARDTLDQALRIAEEIKDDYFTAILLSQRACVARALGDSAVAWEDARQALRLAAEIGAVEPQGWAHQAVAALYHDGGEHAASQAHYAQALQLLRQAGVPGTANEALAGLACAELAQGELGQAQAHVAEIVGYLERGDWLLAAGKPFYIYLTCYQVLVAAGDPRAAEILTRAYTQLQEWAARCPDEATRRSFLENVPWNREIVQEWQVAQSGAE